MTHRKYRLGICPECAVKENDHARTRLYQCDVCTRWFCKKHLEPRPAFIKRPTRLEVRSPQDRAWQSLLAEAKMKEERSHPDFAYTQTRWRSLLKEEQRKSQALSDFLDRAPSTPKSLTMKLPSRKVKSYRPPQKPPHTTRSRGTSRISGLKAIGACTIILIFVGLVYLNWDNITTRIKLPDIPIPDLSDIVPKQEVNIGEVKSNTFTYINDERASKGLPKLRQDSNLLTIASQWSEHLAGTGAFTHGNFEDRIASIGYSYYLCGEIIAMYGGYNSDLARQFVDMWIGSPGHYEIMMTPNGGYMGVGISEGSDGFYAVVDFRFD